jgi:predicted alpha/beta hydrolase
VAEPGLDDVFIDDITLPAADGYPLGATLFLPRGAKRHAVLINSATAVHRKVYRGFAGYLAKRGCAVLTYDYRGTGDSRQKSMTGYNQQKSLVGFKASMSDWAAQDVTSAVAWMRERYKTLPFAYVGHSFGGQALGLLPNNTEISRALFVAAQAGYWKLMSIPERYRVYAMLNFAGVPLTRAVGYTPGWMGLGMDLPKDMFLQWVSWVMSPRYMFDDKNLAEIQRRIARAVYVRRSLGDAAGGGIAVLGFYLDQARDHHGDAEGYRCCQDRPFRFLPPRTSRHAVAGGCGMDRGDGVGCGLSTSLRA